MQRTERVEAVLSSWSIVENNIVEFPEFSVIILEKKSFLDRLLLLLL